MKARLFGTYLSFRDALFYITSFGHKRLYERIQEVGSHKKTNVELTDMLLLTSFRISSSERQKILEKTISITLKEIDTPLLPVNVVDASDELFLTKNREIFEKITKHVQITQDSSVIVDAYLDSLKNSSKKFFCAFFDDQPIVNFTPEFLQAGFTLLNDFKDIVDVILPEYPLTYEINKDTKKIIFDLSKLDYVVRGVTPLGFVRYGNYSFAIIKNYHYGFFFNNLLSLTESYTKKLSWYKKHISEKSAHQIELAGMQRKGPVFNYIAVPLDVFMFDLDFAHTKESLRSKNHDAEDIFNLLGEGFTVSGENKEVTTRRAK